MIVGKKLLIFGGTGSLGNELNERYLDNNIIYNFSRDEHKHVNLKNKYKNLGVNIHEPAGASSTKIKFLVADPSPFKINFLE